MQGPGRNFLSGKVLVCAGQCVYCAVPSTWALQTQLAVAVLFLCQGASPALSWSAHKMFLDPLWRFRTPKTQTH